MRINIEDYLQQIDGAFKDKDQKEIYMTYIMIFAVIFAFSYLLFWESSESDFKAKNSQIKRITKKINSDKRYLKQNPKTKIAQLDKKIKQFEKELTLEKDKNEYIKSKIETISSLIYDERTWGEYLHSISINAKKYNIKILDFKNQYAKKSSSFGHLLDISLKTNGNYKDTIKFINSLEQSDLVVDIHNLNITALQKLDTELKISVWGIRY